MSAVPPRVTPAFLAIGQTEASFGGKSSTVTDAWSFLNGALGYWLPHGLNAGIRAARSTRGKR